MVYILNNEEIQLPSPCALPNTTQVQGCMVSTFHQILKDSAISFLFSNSQSISAASVSSIQALFDTSHTLCGPTSWSGLNRVPYPLCLFRIPLRFWKECSTVQSMKPHLLSAGIDSGRHTRHPRVDITTVIRRLVRMQLRFIFPIDQG
jgi:hypothetical protein